MKRKTGPFDAAPRRSKRIAGMHLDTVATSSQTPPKADFDRQDAMDWTYDADPPKQDRPSPLLSLPAELRNRIYEHVLHEKGYIHITPQLRVPPLLQTSTQVRAEARMMWFKMNRFRIIVVDLDARLIHAWSRNVCPHDLTRGLKISIRPSHNWANLLEWCQQKHSGAGRTWSPIVSSRDPSLKEKTRVVAATALQIARMYRRSTWKDCKKALENHRHIIGAFDAMWMKED